MKSKMREKVFSELAKIDDITFFVLEHHFQIARMVRNAMSQRVISHKMMADILGVSPRSMKSVINGAYEFDLRLLSKLQSYLQDVASNDAKLKIEAESIGFAAYKDQMPIYIHRIEKLLSMLEKQHPSPDTNLK